MTLQKFKVKANKNDLESIGISYDINGLVGDLVKNYGTGWLVLSITHEYNGFKFTNEFDLPKYMCVKC
jgi:hypothetical protein